MATAFAPTKDMEFHCDFNIEKMQKDEESYIDRLRQWCLQNTDSTNPLVGKIIQIPHADGYAVYMVFRTKPLQIIHVATGDAWHADSIWIRGLKLSDVKKMIQREETLNKTFSKETA